MPPLDKGAGGAGNYLLSLLRELAGRAEVRAVVHPRAYGLLTGIPRLQVIPIMGEDPAFFAEQTRWCDVFYDPLNGLRPAFLESRTPILCCIHDLQHNVLPHYFSDAAFTARNQDYGFAIARADGLIAVSEYEKSNFLTVYGKKDVYVTHHSGYLAAHYDVNEERRLAASGRMPDGDYVLYPAVPWRHKNHYRLIEAFGLLQGRPDAPDVRLVLTGALDHSDRARPLFENLLRGADAVAGVDLRGFVPDAELAALFRRAKALVFPSLYEGFGIPLVEAMQSGTPVLAARCAATPEVCGDAVAYFSNPEDSVAMAQDIQALLNDPARLDSLRAAGLARGAGYSNQRMADETLAAFRAVKDGVAARRPVEIVTAEPAARQGKPAELLTVVVDCDDADSAVLADPAGYLADLIARLTVRLPRPHRLALLFPSDMEPAASAGFSAAVMAANQTRENEGAGRLQVIYYDRRLPQRRRLAARFVIDSVLTTRYVLLTRASRPVPMSPRRLRDALALLERYDDVDAAEFIDGAPVYGAVWRPDDPDLVYQGFLRHRDDPLGRFENTLLARRAFERSDALGTVQFLSHYLKSVNAVFLPPTD